MNPKPLTDKQRYWLTHIEHCQEAGQSLASYAQENSLDLNALYRWKSALRKRGCFGTAAAAASTLFTRVAVEQRSRVEGATIQVRFPNGCVLQSDAMDETTLCVLTTALLSSS